MSSFAQLKELAQKRAETEQVALHKERERQEKDAAAKQAAREEQEKAQRERERKILVQKMARQKEEAAVEKTRREQVLKSQQESLDQDEKPRASAAEIDALLSVKRKIGRTGSTQKVDLSGPESSGQAAEPGPRKRKQEDDFVGNRFERAERSKTGRKATPAIRKKAMPLTREEKQAMKRAREFGSIPRSGLAQRTNSAPSLGEMRTHRPKSNGMVALGTMKRDQRSIDEIERDLRKIREAKSSGSSDGRSHAELEREANLLRRQKAMEEKRRADLLAREQASRDATDDGSDDDLFGDESDPERRCPSLKKSATIAPRAATTSPFKRQSEPGSNKELPRAPMRELSPISKARGRGGVNPADFLPGAPLSAVTMAKLAERGKQERSLSSPAAGLSRKSKTSTPMPAEAAPAAASTKRETARDRFIREQAEKKAVTTSQPDGTSRRKPDDSESDQDDEYDSEDDEDDEGLNDLDVRDEIWKMFGKDRRAYARKVVDSDDDMEADAASVLQEELRSAKQAKLEDQREEELERQREREKALKKKKHGQG